MSGYSRSGSGASQASVTAVATSVAALQAALTPTTTLHGTNQLTSGTSDSPSVYTQLIAAASVVKDIPAGSAVFVGGVRNNQASAGRAIVQLAVGGAGSEVVVADANIGIAASGSESFTMIIPRKIAAGTRIAFRASWSGTPGATVDVAYNLGQVA